ncbi:DUF4376 domain-containing protein [Desulfocurvibacter africanus]|uniref:DUF4376 domain-containing protein n=1 Tax=Desulfocurvibacter africanus TaxID=873 RepID=UPI000419F2A0|nr:DUF4376 domain-containing protein [Desulfocurvibacter africanus]
MDIALALGSLVPGARFGGSLTANTREAYDALRWEDGRSKPTWSELEAAWLMLAREAKLSAIHAAKNAARDGGFIVGGVLFDSDAPARIAYMELAAALQQDPTLSTRWKASEGQWVTMDAIKFAEVYEAGRAHIESCFGWQEAREQEISAATTLAELEAVSETYTAPVAA